VKSFDDKVNLVKHFKKEHPMVEISDDEDRSTPAKEAKRVRPEYECLAEKCKYKATIDSLVKHWKRGVHNYTEEQINKAKERLGIKTRKPRKRHFAEE
jgi:predicted small metal-binding protein